MKEVRTQTLWREFEALRMGDSESIDEYSEKLTIIGNKLRGLGNTVDDIQVVKKLLRSTSAKFLQITSTIEEFSDLKMKSVDEIIGSLKAHIERLQGFREKDETFFSLMQNGRNERMQNPQRKKGRIKEVLEEAADGVVEDGEAVGEVTGIEDMKESRKLKRRNLTKVKLNVSGVSKWDNSHQSVPQKTNNST